MRARAGTQVLTESVSSDTMTRVLRIFINHSQGDVAPALALRHWLVDREGFRPEDVITSNDLQSRQSWSDALVRSGADLQVAVFLLSRYQFLSAEFKTDYAVATRAVDEVCFACLEPVDATAPGVRSYDLFEFDSFTSVSIDAGHGVFVTFRLAALIGLSGTVRYAVTGRPSKRSVPPAHLAQNSTWPPAERDIVDRSESIGRLPGAIPKRRTGVFINYRREDEPFAVRMLYATFRDLFGEANIFMDIDNIPIGHDFVDVINDRLETCLVVIVIMGRQWLTCTRPDGTRRIDDPNDFVRLEVEYALARPDDVTVIPIVVGSAAMPDAEVLPPSIRPLVRRQAETISYQRPEADLLRISAKLRQILEA